MRLVTIATFLVIFACAPVSVVAQRDVGALANVKKVYIESVTGQPNPLREPLVRELTKVGFDIVTDRSQADATLTIFPQAEIVVDGDGSIPDKSIFTLNWRFRTTQLCGSTG